MLTSRAIHDLSLLIPSTLNKEKSFDENKQGDYLPTRRIIRILEAVINYSIPQIKDDSLKEYNKFVNSVSSVLNWQAPKDLVKEGLSRIYDFDRLYPDKNDYNIWAHIYTDHKIGLEARLKQLNAFVWHSKTSMNLYDDGWQPVNYQDHHYTISERIPDIVLERKIRINKTIEFNRFIVFGESMKCPYINECSKDKENKIELSDFIGINGNCHCFSAIEYATGGLFHPDDIKYVKR